MMIYRDTDFFTKIHYNVLFMTKLSWEKFLTGETKVKLLEFGGLLEKARTLRGISIIELSE